MSRTIRVEIIGDASSLERSLGKAQVATTGFGTTIAKTLGKAAAFTGLTVGAAELVKFGVEAVRMAGQVQKSTEAIHANFGKAAAGVLEFTDNAAKIGLSARDAEATATQFGLLFKNLGIGQAAAGEMTVGFEQLGAAISQIKGTDPAEVMNKLALAAAGNTRGLKQLGIVVDAATIKQEAFKLGLISSVKDAVTPAIRAQAIYALATQNLGEFQRQAAAHAGDFTNQQRKLNAEWENAKEQLGQALLPVMTKLVTVLAENLPGAIRAVSSTLRTLAPVFQTIGDAIGVLLPIIRPIAQYLFENIVVPFKLIADLIHGDWAKAWSDLKAPVQDAINAIVGIVTPAWNALKTLTDGVWNGISSLLAGIWNGLSTLATSVFGSINTAVMTVWNGISSLTTTVWNGIQTSLTTIWRGLQTMSTTVWTAIRTSIETVWNGLRTAAAATWNAIKTAIEAPINAARAAVTAAVDAIRNIVVSVFSAASGAVSREWNAIRNAITGAINAARAVVASATNAIKTAVNDTFHAFESVGSKLKHLIIDPINYIIEKINSIHIPGFNIHIPGVSIAGHTIIPDVNVGWGGLDPFHVPLLAQGGIITSPTLAMLGEGGHPEAVVPLSGRGLGGHITINVGDVHAATSDPDGLAKQLAHSMVRELQKYARNNALPGLLGT